ncbi:Nta1 [Kluyveromyces lactis]|nr:Nta1 [Kluyveromyces lactis]
MVLTRLKVPLRIGIIQLNPQIGHTKETTSRAWKLLDELKSKNHGIASPDILVFPEFALTGYSFHDRNHILPYTCKPTEGPTFDFAKEVSKTFNCYTVIGYPERCGDDDKTATLYNSAIMTDASGDLVFNYRKSFLYYTDDDWGCQENPNGFQQFEIPVKGFDVNGNSNDVKLKTGLGICMDLSNYKFEAPFSDYEFATYHLDHGTELLICPMAWLHSAAITKDTKDPQQQWGKVKSVLDREGIPEYGSQGRFVNNLDSSNVIKPEPFEHAMSLKEYNDLDTPDITNITYWLLRLTPFVALKKRYEWLHSKLLVPFLTRTSTKTSSYVGSSLDKPWLHEGKETVLVLANRCGIEDKQTVYAGSSGIYKFNGRIHGDEDDSVDTTNKSIELYGNLSKGHEGILVRDVELIVERET